ncbi:MAG TPA: hypothetical protein VGN12_21085 [Pirellulales bacterium]
MESPILPRRRWFQFGLRSLLVVVTLLAFWLAWELHFIRERQRLIRDYSSPPKSWLFGVLTPEKRQQDPSFRWPTIPFWRKWLGDEPVATVCINPFTYSDAKDIESMAASFPEADVTNMAAGWQLDTPRALPADYKEFYRHSPTRDSWFSFE